MSSGMAPTSAGRPCKYCIQSCSTNNIVFEPVAAIVHIVPANSAYMVDDNIRQLCVDLIHCKLHLNVKDLPPWLMKQQTRL